MRKKKNSWSSQAYSLHITGTHNLVDDYVMPIFKSVEAILNIYYKYYIEIKFKKKLIQYYQDILNKWIVRF